jgi:nicotinamidase-related amidase
MTNTYGKLITPEESLLLVIDLQEKFVPSLKHKRRVVESAELLLRTAGVLGIPVVVTEHHPEAIGPTVEPLAGLIGGAERLRKDIFGCFGDDRVRAAVASKKQARTILIAGCETHICIMQTSMQALELGYNVHVAANGVSSRTEIDWITGLDRIAKAGAVIATAEMMAYELLRRSDTPAFKKLLPVFKDWGKREE